MKAINWRKKGKQAVSFALLLWGFFLFGEGLAQWQSTYEDTMAEPEAVLAIVIDDFGYHGEGTEEMIALPVDFTAAVMPFSAQTVQDAQALEAAGLKYQLRLYETGGHGIGLADHTDAAGWLEEAVQFWQSVTDTNT